MGFSSQEYQIGLSCPPPRDRPTQGSNPLLLWLLHCRQILYCWATGEALYLFFPHEFNFTANLYTEQSPLWAKLFQRSLQQWLCFTCELMLLNYGVGENSWESLGLQGDPTSPLWRRSALGFLWKIRPDQSLSRVRLFVTPWTTAHQASLSITNSQSLLKLMFIELVMPSNHLILCHPLLLLPPIFFSLKVLMSQLFASGGQSFGASDPASVFPINIQD